MKKVWEKCPICGRWVLHEFCVFADWGCSIVVACLDCHELDGGE